MPKLAADPSSLSSVNHWLLRKPELAHLRAKRRGDLITLVSGPEGDSIPHARIRRVTTQWWTLELSVRAGRWEPTDLRSTSLEVLDAAASDFPWVFAPRE